MRVRFCVCRPRPTHTAQRPSYTHIREHTHTTLSFQNTQHLYKTAKHKKKKVPDKTLQTSFSVTVRSLITVSSPLHSWHSHPPIRQDNIILLRIQSKRNTFFHLVSLFLEMYLSSEIQSQPWLQLTTQYSCFLSSPSRCPCHAIMRNSVRTLPHKRNAHKRRFKETEKVSKRLFSVSDYKVSLSCDCVSCKSTTSSAGRELSKYYLQIHFLNVRPLNGSE